MKKFTKLWQLMLVLMLSTSVVLGQSPEMKTSQKKDVKTSEVRLSTSNVSPNATGVSTAEEQKQVQLKQEETFVNEEVTTVYKENPEFAEKITELKSEEIEVLKKNGISVDNLIQNDQEWTKAQEILADLEAQEKLKGYQWPSDLLSPYAFTQSTGTYTEITGGTVLGSETSDDQRFVDPAVPLGGFTNTGVGFDIGFDFEFNGYTFDRFAINNNGWMSLGHSSETPSVDINSSSSYNPLSSTTTNTPGYFRSRIAPLAVDIQAQTGAELRYELTGTTPNQVLVIQFKNYRKYGATGDLFNFQIRLYETTDVVEFVYGTVTNNATSTTVMCGLGGDNNLDFINRITATDWSATTAGATSADEATLSATVFPASGLTFAFTPPAVFPPNPAFGPDPTDAAIDILLDADLGWTFGDNTDTYDLFFDVVNPPLVQVVTGATATNPGSYDPGTMNYGTTYYWQVVDIGVGGSTAGPVWSFTTLENIPYPATNPNPEDGAPGYSVNVDLSWDFGFNNENYDVYFGETDSTMALVVNDALVPGATGTYDPGTLDADSTYYWQIVTRNSTKADTAGPVWSFDVGCDAFTPDYLDEFTTFLPTCWNEAGDGDATTGPIDIGTGIWTGPSTAIGTGSARINLYFDNRSEWLLSPFFDLSAGGYEARIDVAVTNWNNGDPDAMGSDDAVQLLYTEDGSTWNNLYTWTVADALPNAPTTFTFALTSTGANVQFGILATDGPIDDLEDYDFHVDEFIVQIPPACVEPTALTVGSITETTATASWTPQGSENDWYIEVGAPGFTPGTGNELQAYTKHDAFPFPPISQALSLLNPATMYDVYVQAACDLVSDTSTWVGPVGFTTACPAYIPPFVEDFEGGVLPVCWAQETTDDLDWTVYSGSTGSSGTGPTAAYSNTYYIYVETSGSAASDSAVLYTPEVDISTLTLPQLVFAYHMYGLGMTPNGTLDIDITDDGGANYTNVWSLKGDQGNNWFIAEVDLSAYTGIVGFRITGIVNDDITGGGNYYENDFAIDLFRVRETPTCLEPTNLAVNSLTSSSADAIWTSLSGFSNVEWGLVGFTPGVDPVGTAYGVTADSVNMSGLLPDTDYHVYVQDSCGVGDLSAFVGPVAFTTYCEVICPVGGVAESEPCGDDTNGGCNMAGTPVYETIPPSGIVCGTAWAEGGSRDTDWYTMTLAAPGNITMIVEGQQAMVYGLISSSTPGTVGCVLDCADPGLAISPAATSTACEPDTLVFSALDAGTYYFFVGLPVYEGFPCDVNYVATWTTTPYTPDPGDFCSNAIPATVGLNTDAKQPSWYTFAGNDQMVTVTSCIDGQTSDTWLLVYDGCCGTLLAENDDDPNCAEFSSTLEFFAEVGTTYYLHWSDAISSDTIDFEIFTGLPVADLSATSFTADLVENGNAFDDLMVGNTGDYPLNYTTDIAYGGDVFTVTCNPMAVNNWTGTTTTTAKTDTSEVRGLSTEDGWFMFDISAIPAGVTVLNVEFFGYVNATNWPYWSMTPVTSDPLTADAATLSADITAEASLGYYLYQNESSAYATGLKQHTLLGNANNDLEAAITNGWFAMGMVSRDNSLTYFVNWDGWNEANPPYIEVTYTTEPVGWLNLDGGSSTVGSVAQGAPADDILVGFDAAGIPPGTYTADINITTNEPDLGADLLYTIPVTMNVVAGVAADLKVYLEGPYDTTLLAMNTDLFDGAYLPLGQPYNPTLPYYGKTPVWLYAGTESVTAIPDTTVVDWVVVQLRDAVDSAAATPATIVAEQAAFLLEDGTIVGLDGKSRLGFAGVTPVNDLFAVIYHRNHLGVMSANALAAPGGFYTYDFTTGVDQVYGGASGHLLVDVSSGIWGMVAADGDADGGVLPSDKTSVWLPDANLTGYRGGDFNMNGVGQPNDLTDYWLPNSNTAGQIPLSKGEEVKGYQSQIPK